MTSSSTEKIEVITSVQRRRRWAPAEKRAIVEETYQPGMTVSYVARQHGISPSMVFKWRQRMEEGALTAVGSEERVVPEGEVKALQGRIRELERVLGKKTLENEILREAVRIGREKKLISRQPLFGKDDGE
jgi:transposase